MRILTIIREIQNYFYQLSVIRKHKKTPEWTKHKLRVNWFGTIGTVINLPPDVFQGEEIYYQVYLIEQMKPINRYLETLNLHEIIYPRTYNLVDPSKGEYAFLIKYKPLFVEFTWWWILTRSAFVALLSWIQVKFGAAEWLYGLAMELVGKIM